MGNTTPGLWMLKMCDGVAGLANCYGFYNGQFNYLHNEFLQPAAAATNGANVNSPYWEQCGNGYQTVTSASAGDCVRLVVALSNTVNTPTSIWTLAYVDGANLTPLHSIDFSAATSGFKVPYLIPGTIFSAAGTALPTCAAALKGAETVVSDATTPTYMGAYASGGTITTAVICSFNGTTYAWLTH